MPPGSLKPAGPPTKGPPGGLVTPDGVRLPVTTPPGIMLEVVGTWVAEMDWAGVLGGNRRFDCGVPCLDKWKAFILACMS